METLAAVNALLALTETIANMAATAQAISAIIKKAQDEGRTHLTADEWAVITNADDAARKRLVADIA